MRANNDNVKSNSNTMRAVQCGVHRHSVDWSLPLSYCCNAYRYVRSRIR